MGRFRAATLLQALICVGTGGMTGVFQGTDRSLLELFKEEDDRRLTFLELKSQLKLKMVFYRLGSNLVECLWIMIRGEAVKMT